jgi:hypothetical protein
VWDLLSAITEEHIDLPHVPTWNLAQGCVEVNAFGLGEVAVIVIGKSRFTTECLVNKFSEAWVKVRNLRIWKTVQVAIGVLYCYDRNFCKQVIVYICTDLIGFTRALEPRIVDGMTVDFSYTLLGIFVFDLTEAFLGDFFF